MSNESIFSKVVRSEDSYTQLLCNLMKRDESFRAQVLLLLFPEDNVVQVKPDQIYTQNGIGEDGRPDIVIKTDTTLALVEVKTEEHRGRTKTQVLIGTGRNYLRYLEDRHKPDTNMSLNFLVPYYWKFLNEVEDEIATLKRKGAIKGIPVKLIFWEQIIGLLSKDYTRKGTSLLEEFRLHLSENFGPVTFFPKEVTAMFSKTFPLHAALKLNAVLDGLRRKAGKNLASPMVIKKDESGFYLKKGKRWLFYVGCWRTFWDDDNRYPICFGVEDDAPILVTAFKNAFRKAYKKEAVPCGKWTMGWVPDDDFEGPDAVEQIWSKLKPIWEAVARAAK